MTTVFVVTSGEYSDYKIEAIRSTKAKAEDFIAIMARHSDDFEIAEWELDTFPGAVGDLFKFSYNVWPDTGATLLKNYEGDADFKALGELVVYDWGRVFITYVLARDPAHALKIGRDRWAVVKAQHEGLT